MPSRTHRSAEASEAGKDKPYKSPPRKLVRFFEGSRDQWKEKCLAAKAAGKGLKNRMRFLERSKAHGKSRVQDLEGELTWMKAQAQAMQEELGTLKKRRQKTKEG
jgi:molecular chaperone GrpE (heat shock protein)